MRLFSLIQTSHIATTLFTTSCVLAPIIVLPGAAFAQAAVNGPQSLAVLEIKDKQVTLSAGTDEGVVAGAVYTLMRNGQIAAQLRITEVLATQSIAQLETDLADNPLVVGDMVNFLAGPDRRIATPPVTLPPAVPVVPGVPPQLPPTVPVPSGPLTPIAPSAAGTPATPLAPLPSTVAPTLVPQTGAPAPTVVQPSPSTPSSTIQIPLRPEPEPVSTRKNKNAENDGFKLLEATGAVQTVVPDGSVTINLGYQEGIRKGDSLAVLRANVAVGTVRITQVETHSSTGRFKSGLGDDQIQVGDIVQQNAESAERRVEPRRRNNGLDYAGVVAATLAVLVTDKDTSSSLYKNFVGTQEFSAIAPFPGNGYSILPSGKIDPGGAMQVNIPMAYTPHHLTGVIGGFQAQQRPGESILKDDNGNGTLNLGVGFGLNDRGFWISRMILSRVGLDSNGGDRAYNVQYQIIEEDKKVPAIAAGIQDFTNAREFSPYVVATKQIPTSRPLFVTLGYAKGRFSGKPIIAGVSFVPIKRVSLAAEFDGIQYNIGASLALTRRFTLMASYNDLSRSDDRVSGPLGRRYQFGGNFRF